MTPPCDAIGAIKQGDRRRRRRRRGEGIFEMRYEGDRIE
jgi:hypothetical protein